MLNRIRHAITRTRERHAPRAAACHPRTLARRAPALRSRAHEYVLAGEETSLVRP